MVKKDTSKKNSATFWNKEYQTGEHLAMSTEPSGDMLTFVKWVQRNSEWPPFPKNGLIIDAGCGNGRNIVPLCGEYNMRGIGIDISGTAIEQAKAMSKEKGITKVEPDAKVEKKERIKFYVQSLAEKIPAEDQSVDVFLDMMTGHFLKEDERKEYVKEVARVMKPYGWMFFKTFVLDSDSHAIRLIKENPAGEHNSYIHPRIDVYEHVFTDDEIIELFSPYFKIYKMIKSYKHIKDGKAYKRRTISVYMEKLRD